MKVNCGACNKAVKLSVQIQCDDCKKFYHQQCIASNTNIDNEKDLIHICESCAGGNQIYNAINDQSMVEKQSNDDYKKVLRSGKTLQSHIPVKSNAKMKCANNESQMIKIIECLQTKVDILEKKVAKLESGQRKHVETIKNTTSKLQMGTNTSVLCANEIEYKSRFIEIDTKVNALNSTIKSCEALLELSATHDKQIQKQFREMNSKIKLEITERIEGKWDFKRMANEYMNTINEAVETQEKQINDLQIEIAKKLGNTMKHANEYVNPYSSFGKELINQRKSNALSKNCAGEMAVTTRAGKTTAIIPTEKATTNTISHAKLAANRFEQPVEKYTYTKQIKVIMRDTHITCLDTFANDFTKQFEAFMGKNTVNNVAILKYTVRDKIIHRMEIYVKFHIPLNHQYMNGFRFPINWSFLQQHINGRIQMKYSGRDNNKDLSKRPNRGSMNV